LQAVFTRCTDAIENRLTSAVPHAIPSRFV